MNVLQRDMNARAPLEISLQMGSIPSMFTQLRATGFIGCSVFSWALACVEASPGEMAQTISADAGNAKGAPTLDAGATFEYEVPSCDSPLPGLDLSGRPEGEGDFADELARLDAISSNGGPQTFETESLAPFFREVVAYLLMIPVSELGTLRIDALLAGPPLARSVALAFLEGDGRRPDINILRRALHRFYFCEQQLPLYLDDLRTLAGEMDPDHDILIENSRPKAHHRRLTANVAETFFFAETLIEGEVRETEVLWRGHRPDGALEFLVYNAAGVLQDASYFVTSEGPETAEASPYACMACHRDRHAGSGFTVTLP